MGAHSALLTRASGPATRRATRERQWQRSDTAAAAALYLLAAAVNLLSVWTVSRSLVLMGEEMSVSIRDPLFNMETRTQASVWSTNFVAPVYYWAASHVDPSYSLFSARRWKAIAMALIPPLVYLVLRRRLRCARPPAVFGGVVAALIPGLMMFGWVATENGLESLIGAAGVYLATSTRSWWRTAPVLAGLAVSTYTSGVAWAVVILGVCGWRAWRSDRRRADRLVVGAAAAAAAGVVLFPRLWWTGGLQRIVAGGGTFEGSWWDHGVDLVRQLAISAESYYFFGEQAALGSVGLAAAVLVCGLVAWRRREVRPWFAVVAVTMLMWLPTGNVPGVRRAVAISIVAALVVGVAADIVLKSAPRPALARVGVLVAAAAVVVPLAVTAGMWQLENARGERTLIADFPIATGPMPVTFAAWDRQLRVGDLTAAGIAREHDGLRTLAVVWMLAERSGAGTEGLPVPGEIVEATVPADLLPR